MDLARIDISGFYLPFLVHGGGYQVELRTFRGQSLNRTNYLQLNYILRSPLFMKTLGAGAVQKCWGYPGTWRPPVTDFICPFLVLA